MYWFGVNETALVEGSAMKSNKSANTAKLRDPFAEVRNCDMRALRAATGDKSAHLQPCYRPQSR